MKISPIGLAIVWLACHAGSGFAQAATSADAATLQADAASLAPARYVNPFIGTANASVPATDPIPAGSRGGTFPGATTPFGMVQWTPMTPSVTADGNWDEPIGYVYTDRTIIGFPLTQMSGSGCHGNEGELPIMPTLDPASVISQPTIAALQKLPANFQHGNEEAHPGYYRVKLDDGIQVELSATARTGMGRFSYPAGTARPMVVIDATYTNTLTTTSGEIAADPADDSAVSGWTQGGNFCGGRQYKLYFYARFDRKLSAEVEHGRAVLSFDNANDAPLLMKVGLSYVSAANAEANLDAENPGSAALDADAKNRSWNFERIRAEAAEAWNRRLGVVQVRGGSDTDRRKFYTALYHSFLSPNLNSDADGEYLGFDQQIHRVQAGRRQYVNYSNWDVYRSLFPLQAMLFPSEASDMLQSLVNDADQCGAIPRWAPVNADAGIMPGDSGVATVAGGYVFGARDFDAKDALHYMLLAGNQPGVSCTGDVVRDSAGRMSGYLSNGYVDFEGWWTGSIGFEFATTDFAISRLAKALGDSVDEKVFLGRSATWKSQFNIARKQLLPRYTNGDWDLNPVQTPAEQDMVEANAEQYTWMSSYDTRSLFALAGGNAAVIQRLDAFFTDLNAGMTKPNFYIGNEPSFYTPWLYDWAGAPWRTQKVVRDVITQVFTDDAGGLPGNDDLGAVSSWYVWSSLGLFPAITGVGGLAVGSPAFERISLHWADGRNSLSIDGKGAGPYVQSLRLDGKPQEAPWLWLDQLDSHSHLDFALGQSASGWGGKAAGWMPSYGLEKLGSLAEAFDNQGIRASGQAADMHAAGNSFDQLGWSYAADALAKAGAAPGATMQVGDVAFRWPDGMSGLDNMISRGQTIRFATPVPGSKLAILGSASGNGGALSGELVVTYDDGSQATATLLFDDWTLGGGAKQPVDRIALSMPQRVTLAGQADPVNTYVFYWDMPLDGKHAVKSIGFPPQLNQGGLLHVFSIALK